MKNELREAIDTIRDRVDDGQLIDATNDEELLIVLEAAQLYLDQLDEEYDEYDGY